MDTPERNRICTPLSKFEDSPVFNYINSLSPIKPVRSANISQTFSSLSFSSPPSVFTSPHVSSQKESRFLRRHFFSDSSKSGLSTDNGIEGNTRVTDAETVEIFNCSAGPPKNLDSGSAIREVNPPNENLELAIELPRTLKYDCNSPESNTAPRHGFGKDSVLGVSRTSSTLHQFDHDFPLKRCSSLKNVIEAQELCQLEQKKDEGEGSDWENLISDATGLLVFDPPNDSEASKEQLDPNISSLNSHVSTLPQDSTDDFRKTESDILGNNLENAVAQSGEVEDLKDSNHTPHKLPSTSQSKKRVNFQNEKIDDKAETDYKQQRGTRRRCLLFEMVGGKKRSLEDNSRSSSSISPSNGKFGYDDRQLVPFKTGSSSSPCMLPGIGLHLNALAATGKDPRVVKHETLPSGRQVISMSSHITSLHTVVSEENSLNKTFSLNSVEKDMGPAVNEGQVIQDASQASGLGVGEEFIESGSPRKRRRRLEHGGDESCKRCNCKKSKCLKLYCECFAAGVYCVEPCSCLDCFNKPVHEDTVLATRKQIESRNPLAFAPKVISPVLDIGEEPNKTPASARHKKGCNCKKSGCLKKYCECFQGGVGCSINCRCEGCKNAFGTKDGSVPVGEEIELEDEELVSCEKNSGSKSLQISELHMDKEDQYPDHVMPITPFQICRMSVQLEFSSSIGKPPRPSIFSVGSSPRLQPNLAQNRSEVLPTPLQLEKHFHIACPEDETPEILKGGDSSPISGVKTTSPNRKRVSPPHGRSTRKLVLQSIPSFPSLAFHDQTDDHQ